MCGRVCPAYLLGELRLSQKSGRETGCQNFIFGLRGSWGQGPEASLGKGKARHNAKHKEHPSFQILTQLCKQMPSNIPVDILPPV